MAANIHKSETSRLDLLVKLHDGTLIDREMQSTREEHEVALNFKTPADFENWLIPSFPALNLSSSEHAAPEQILYTSDNQYDHGERDA